MKCSGAPRQRRDGIEREQSGLTLERERKAKGRHVLKPTITADGYTSRDVQLFFAAIETLQEDAPVAFNPQLDAQFGVLYRISWAVQEGARRYQLDGNPLHAWDVISVLTDPEYRVLLDGNGAAIAKLERSLGRLKPGPRRTRVAIEIGIRRQIGERPFPPWVADYLHPASRALRPARDKHPKPERVAQVLGLAKERGGRSAYAELADPRQHNKREALRFIRITEARGVRLSRSQISALYDVSTSTAEDWIKEATGINSAS